MSDSYSSPQPEAGMPVLEPRPIKVFGILHLVFGGIGVFGFLMAGVQLYFKEAIMKASAGGDPQMYELQKGINEASLVPTMIGLVIGLVVTVMILRAGFKLIKLKRDAVQASVLYSYVSVGAKLVTLILALTYTLPALNEVFDRMASETGGTSPQVATMITTMKMSMAASSVLTPLLMCIYPILSLIMLKKKNIRDYLAQHGK